MENSENVTCIVARSLQPLDRPTLILVCAGETQLDLCNELIGWDDPTLTERGHEQAKQAAQKVVELRIPLHHIYVSTLQRMRQTGQHISEATGVNITVTDAIAPWDFGDFAGTERTPSELAKL